MMKTLQELESIQHLGGEDYTQKPSGALAEWRAVVA